MPRVLFVVSQKKDTQRLRCIYSDVLTINQLIPQLVLSVGMMSSSDKKFMVTTKSKGKGKTGGNPEPFLETPPQVIEGLEETVHKSHNSTGRELDPKNGQPGETFSKEGTPGKLICRKHDETPLFQPATLLPSAMRTHKNHSNTVKASLSPETSSI